MMSLNLCSTSNGLDNRTSNLRLTTHQQNSYNSLKRTIGTSKYKGVYWDKESRKWKAQIAKDGNGTKKSLYRSTDEIEAAKMYDRAALFFFGEYAMLNFPDLKESYLYDLWAHKYSWMS